MNEALEQAIPIYEDTAGEYRFRVIAGNGEIVAQGEGYKTLVGAERGRATLIRIVLETVKSPFPV